MLYLVKISFRNEEEIKITLEKGKLRELDTSRLTLKECLKTAQKRKEMIKEELLEHRERRKNRMNKNISTTDFPSSLELSK